MLTKRHYEKIAEIINEIEDSKRKSIIASHFADVFKKDNPRFSYKRFGDAIGCKFYITGYIPK